MTDSTKTGAVPFRGSAFILRFLAAKEGGLLSWRLYDRVMDLVYVPVLEAKPDSTLVWIRLKKEVAAR